MLLDDTYPQDIRVAKEADALQAAGHDVILLCYRGEGEPERELIDGVEVLRRPLRGTYDGLRNAPRGGKYLLTRIHQPWLSAIEEVVTAEGVDALHPHDLPLVKTALRAGERHDLPVVADLHENWPEAVRQYRMSDTWQRFLRQPAYLLSRVATPIPRLKRLERYCVQRADRVITVAEEARRHYVSDCEADPDRVTVVSNTVKLANFDPAKVEPAGYDSEFVLAYVGSLGGKHRGLGSVIDAMPEILEAIPNARLLIVGSGPTYESLLRRRCRKNDVADRVTFTGWVEFEEVSRYIAAADVCLVPHRSTPHTETTLPHKLFQYMALRKPVIVTDVTSLARIVNETRSGLVVPPADPEAMSVAVKRLYANPNRTAEFGANGRRAVETTYNWEADAARFTELYDRLGSEEPGRGGGAPESSRSGVAHGVGLSFFHDGS